MGTKTVPPEVSDANHLRGRTVRQISVGVMVVFVLAGAASFLGVKTETAHSATGEYTLDVDYGRISRAGLNTPLRVHVARQGGFSGPLTLGITQSYMSLFDLNAFYPNPSGMTVSDRTLLFEFEKPEGEVFNFTLDAKVGPSLQRGKAARISVIEGGTEVVGVDVSTIVVP